MNDGVASLRRRLRHAARRLRNTPLHPQWLVDRQRRGQVAWLAERAVGAVLDVGCAAGRLGDVLGQSRYVGLDYPSTAIGLYGTRPQVFGDAHRLPFADEVFDTIVVLDVLEHLIDPRTALRECARVLKPGGRLLISVPFAYPLHDEPHDYQRYTRYGLAMRLRHACLEVLELEEVGEGVSTAGAMLAIAMAQGAVEALARPSWRTLLVPAAAILIPLVNVLSVLVGVALPARSILPGAYFVHAQRPV